MSPAAKPPGPGTVDVTPAAMAAAKLGMMDKLLAAIEKQPSLAQAQDAEGESGGVFHTRQSAADSKLG